MEGIYPHLTARTCLSFLFLILLQPTASVGQDCPIPEELQFSENNTVGHVLAEINVGDGVTLSFQGDPPDGFILEGNQLKVNKVFDRENGDQDFTTIRITCSGPGGASNHQIVVFCLNINDNPPVFTEKTFDRKLPEMSPVGTRLGPFAATDLDGTQPRYTLKTENSAFRLEDPTRPYLIVEALLEYDKVKNVELVIEATDTVILPDDPVFTDTATISITIEDVDNRPPWFRPCTEHEINGALVCQSNGYTGKVILNEQETGVLPLKPEPIFAYDGDVGINEEITYSFLGGDADGLFVISETTGGITMTRPADVLGTVSLTVLAAQKKNTFQFSTATVSISVQEKSLHLPKFQKTPYNAVISSVGSQALDSTGEPLQILATDDDYISTGGFNPHITYSITGSTDFSIINGYLFMTKEVPDSTLSLEVVATDKSNDDEATAPLSVEVKSGPSTSPPPTTTGSKTTALTEEPTTNSKTTGVTAPTSSPSMTTDDSHTGPTTSPGMTTDDSHTGPTTSPGMTTDGSVSSAVPTTPGDLTVSTMPTSDPSMTSEGASTDHPPTVIVPSGGYGPADMAALGATLGVLLFICIIAITVLALRVQRGKSDWKKIYETNIFRNTLGQGSGPKDSMQYINDAFVNDEDGDDPGSGGAGEQIKNSRAFTLEEAIEKSTAAPPLGQGDDTSLAESDKTDDKEVKPILTKERRMGDDGYKSVWFKEDIDPNAKEEVVIIPDSREEEDSEGEEEDKSEEEEESSSKEDNEDENPGFKAPRVAFNDTDLDSGLGVKMGDPAEDSESGEMLSEDL